MANEVSDVSERRWLVAIFFIYILLSLGYSLLMPVWEAPDEPAHFHLAWHIAMKDTLPTEEHNYEVVQPHAYYYFASFVIRGLERIDPDFTAYFIPKEYKHNIRIPERRFDWDDANYRFMLGVLVLRWINIVIGALALWVGWKAFGLIVPDKPTLRLTALALAAFTPQYLHIMSSVSNDALGTLAGACLFYLAINISQFPSPGRKPPGYQNEAAAITAAKPPLGVSPAAAGLRTSRQGLQSLPMNAIAGLLSVILAIILPLITKLTVLPVSAAVLAVVAGKWFFGLRQKRWLILAGLVFLLSIGILYVVFPEAIQWTWQEISWRLFGLRKKGLTPEYLKLIFNQILATYWGKVGWIAVGLPNWIIYGLTVLGLTGIVLQVRRLIREKRAHPELGTWIAVLLIASFTALAVARNGLTTGATQGRFLFPAIGALSLLMISGWYGILPEKYQRYLPLIVTVLMVALTLGLWIFGIIPVYYQPFFD